MNHVLAVQLLSVRRHPVRRRLAAGLLALLAFASAAALLLGARPASAPADPATAVTKQRSLDAYAKLPLTFVPNAGQTDARVRFYTHGPGRSFYFTPRAAVLAFTKRAEGKERGVALHLRFAGANPAPRIEGVQTGSGTVNYFVGPDPARWQTGIRTFHAVVYRDLWPGTAMLFRGLDGKLKYEFRLAPGADPSKIRLAYAGATSLSVGAAGRLRIATPLGVLTDARPLAYQRIDGRKVPVESRYALNGGAGAKRSYGFALGSYDRRHPLVIDPGLAYSTFLGGSGAEVGRSVALDGDGNAYVTGETSSLNFPTTAGAFDAAFNGVSDAFVAKLNDEGSALVYSTYLGGGGFDLSLDIAVDERRNAYVAGFTDSSDFPTTPGAFQEADPGPGPSPEGDDGFVAKLNRSGEELVYSTYAGGAGEDSANAIAVDEEGHVYVASAGATSSFPTSAGAPQPTDPGPGGPVLFGQDGILFKLTRSGSALIYATYLGGEARDLINSMTIDSAGNMYVTGGTDSRNFPTTPGAVQEEDPQPVPADPAAPPDPNAVQPATGPDAFVTKLNASGTAFVYSTYLGGTGSVGGLGEGGIGIGVARDGSTFVGGRTDSTDFPTTLGAHDTTHNGGGNDVFVTKLNVSGTALVFSTYLGGTGFEEGSRFQVALDREGRASVTGETDSNDFPTTAGAFQPARTGGFDAFVTTLNPSGSALVHSTYLGGSGTDIPNGIVVDRSGNVYVTGRTGSANFPTTAGAFDTTFNGGGRDVFVTKLDLE